MSEEDDTSGERHRQSRLFTTDDGEFDAERARAESLPVEEGAVVDTDALSQHQTYYEGRGVYDERNRLNELTGREWKFATKSVIPKHYPPALCHDLRSEHGGQKPPRLCMDLIERFSKAGERVLDPFAGVGGTLLGASLAAHEGTGRREAVGFERNERWIEVYETVLERENGDRRAAGKPELAGQEIRHGDCGDLIEAEASNSIDLLLADVPYWDMDEREQTRNEREVRESSLGRFDGEEGATGRMASSRTPRDKDEWLADMAEKFEAFARVVRPDRYVVVFIGDMYREQAYEFLSADLAGAIADATPLSLVANLVWYDPGKDLHVYGYPFSFVPSMVHQNVLVFRVDGRESPTSSVD